MCQKQGSVSLLLANIHFFALLGELVVVAVVIVWYWTIRQIMLLLQ